MWVHPRAGGENAAVVTVAQDKGGPSPRWRGKHGPVPTTEDVQGSIPALAGETIARSARRCCLRVHPRAGGGNLAHVRQESVCPGSIPALAGKTLSKLHSHELSRVHPRAGGENTLAFTYLAARRAPSPRWRGKRYNGPSDIVRTRSIPALAGKTLRA